VGLSCGIEEIMGGGVCFGMGPPSGWLDSFRWAAVMVGDASLLSSDPDSITGFDDWTYFSAGVGT